MRRSSALLATAVLAAASFLVPATAEADVTDSWLTLTFDRLSKDRVARIKLSAKSPSGVTGVVAKMRYKSTSAEPYATVPLQRTEGTDNDGVWQTDYQTDINAHPGLTVVEVLITTRDTHSYSKWSNFNDCYTTTIADLTASPAAIDVEHQDVTLRGRAMFQTDGESAPQPAPNATVNGPTSQRPDGTTSPNTATTGADGTFTMRYTGAPRATANVPAQGPLCGRGGTAPLTVTKQTTEVTAKRAPGPAVAPGAEITVEGKVVRHGSTGTVPAVGATVSVDIPSDMAQTHPMGVTGADGTYKITFKAGPEPGKSAFPTVHAGDSGFLVGSDADLGLMWVGNGSKLVDFETDKNPSPFPYGDPFVASVRLDLSPGILTETKQPVYLEYSFDDKTWKTWETATLDGEGSVYFGADKAVTKDAYWRARYPGSALSAPAVTESRFVDVKYRTEIYNFNASPEPVAKGKTITVQGLLNRFQAVAGPAPNAPVAVYFKPAGSSGWTKMADTKTATNGWFKKTFKATKDGTWMARFLESGNYLGSNAPTDYVDVR
ncbi:hypothetical protein [Actinomadura decatromicini]|uniref:Carboxypeptidase regulatory-like domain-containing protein n=1 Tax=Actinomadura decatromicini TaxID=2604572 RepID=A0A5D3FNY6_9ACTN|nr:hypothetical protein [Actinomadura decatromicini]TYK50517.1 hypothetical protein FXF68_08320 [Actinomadura decatromicini]